MWDSKPTVKTEAEVQKIRESSKLLAEAFELAGSLVAPGISSLEINDKVDEFITKAGARPAFKGYQVGSLKFPYACCMSLNEAVVHGLPTDTPLVEGDILSVDIGVEKDGWYGDSAWTYPVGEVSSDVAKLLEVTQESLMLGIAQAKDGGRVYDISKAIQDYCVAHGYGIVKDLVGHGIGRELHEEPQVPNYLPHRWDKGFRNIKLVEGMTLAIEPMITMGTWRVRTLKDGWTVVTADAKPSAHFEHTVVVRPWGGEILTKV